MSRIGKIPVKIPEKVAISVVNNKVSVGGPLGTNEHEFDNSVIIEQKDGYISVRSKDANDGHSRVMHGTVRSIINSMVIGVVSGYSKSLEISGVGFKAVMKGKSTIDLSLGYSHEVLYDVPSNIKLTIDQTGTKIEISGVDKQMVGQVAADIKRYYPVEPYKGKGIRIVGEYVRRKEGKKTA